MTLKKPEITLNELRSQKPKAAELLDVIIRGLFEKSKERLAPVINRLGYEATYEIFESLIEKGFLKIQPDNKGEAFWLTVYNPLTGKYEGC